MFRGVLKGFERRFLETFRVSFECRKAVLLVYNLWPCTSSSAGQGKDIEHESRWSHYLLLGCFHLRIDCRRDSKQANDYAIGALRWFSLQNYCFSCVFVKRSLLLI